MGKFGILLGLLILLAAWKIGTFVPAVGAPIFAILLGALTAFILRRRPRALDGAHLLSKQGLQLAIILLGANLDMASVWRAGTASFGVMIGTLAIALTAGLLGGRLLQIPPRLTQLITVGTGICGASAIASISPIIEAESSEIAYAVSTIFLFNVIAVFLFPLLGHVLHFSNAAFGLWAGTAINDTSSVVAAGYAYSQQAGVYATIVKLTRSLTIIPISLFFLGATRLRRNKNGHGTGTAGSSPSGIQVGRFPWFILGFLGMSVLHTFHLLGPFSSLLGRAGQLLIVLALAGVGLGTNVAQLRKAGIKPMLLGLFCWGCVAVGSVLLQTWTGNL